MVSKKQLTVLWITIVLLFLINISLFTLFYLDYRTKTDELNNLIRIVEKDRIDADAFIMDQLIRETNERANFEIMTYENFNNLENYITNRTTNLQLDFETRIGEVSQEIAGFESRIDRIRVSSNDFSDIIEEVAQAVVSIRTNRGIGSGVFFHKDGYIMTNRHVIENTRSINAITYNGTVFPVRIIGTAVNADLAVLQITTGGTFPFLRFEEDFRIGERVIAIGNPLGLAFSVTEGIISGSDRVIDNTGIGYIQTDVSINSGNSGGPLVNSGKRIVGINTFKISATEGLGFAIPASVARDIGEQALSVD
ncbi:MAG: S1C family serine protease [Candidatus Woesearchaeota archaeon]